MDPDLEIEFKSPKEQLMQVSEGTNSRKSTTAVVESGEDTDLDENADYFIDDNVNDSCLPHKPKLVNTTVQPSNPTDHQNDRILHISDGENTQMFAFSLHNLLCTYGDDSSTSEPSSSSSSSSSSSPL